MSKRAVSFSDISNQMAGPPDELTPLVVTDYPNSDPNQSKRIEVTRDELEKIGKMAIDTVGLETEPTEEDEKRQRFVVPFGKLATLTTAGPLEEVLANAELVEPPKQQRQSQRRSHNERADGGPLVNYNDPDNAGLQHKGRIGDKEAAWVRDNLELANARRTEAGQPPIDPANELDAKRYGFPAPGK